MQPSPLPRPLTPPAAPPSGAIAPGDEIEIWCRSLGSWSHGFVAVDVDAEGWRVLRRSDRAPLPVRFPDTEVRAA